MISPPLYTFATVSVGMSKIALLLYSPGGLYYELSRKLMFLRLQTRISKRNLVRSTKLTRGGFKFSYYVRRRRLMSIYA